MVLTKEILIKEGKISFDSPVKEFIEKNGNKMKLLFDGKKVILTSEINAPEFINYLKSNATSNVSLKQVRKELSAIKGSLSEEIIKDREEKL